MQGDAAAGDDLFNQAAAIARQYGDRDLACKAAQGRGRALIVRPYLIHSLVEPHEAGYVNGPFAQAQQLTRAAGPVLAALAVTAVPYSAVLALLGVAFAALTTWTVLRYASRRAGGGMLKVENA